MEGPFGTCEKYIGHVKYRRYAGTVSAGYKGIPHNGNLAITEGSCGFQQNPIQITENLAVTDSISFSGNFLYSVVSMGEITVKHLLSGLNFYLSG